MNQQTQSIVNTRAPHTCTHVHSHHTHTHTPRGIQVWLMARHGKGKDGGRLLIPRAAHDLESKPAIHSGIERNTRSKARRACYPERGPA